MKCAVFLLLLTVCVSHADYAPYQGKANIEFEAQGLLVKHSHDWGNPPVFDILENPYSPFSEKNTVSWIELWDIEKGERLWKIPSPALTKVWISPKGEYVVGLSKIQWLNDYQLVIFSGEGVLVVAKHISTVVAKLSESDLEVFRKSFPELATKLEIFTEKEADSNYIDFYPVSSTDFPLARRELYRKKVANPKFPNAKSSVTNWIFWFDERVNPSIVESEAGIFLHVMSNTPNRPDDEANNIEIPIAEQDAAPQIRPR